MIPIYTFDCDPIEGIFIERPNRFLGIVQVDNEKIVVHIHDPGRVPLLKPNTKVLLCPTKNRNRKTKFDLIAFWHNEWIFSHSGYHSLFFELTLRKTHIIKFNNLRREVKLVNSRIDFLLDDKLYIEVKGCTWIINGNCYFPDAPTERGRRHIMHLAELARKGISTRVIFLTFSSQVNAIGIARSVDKKFFEAFESALKSGVMFEGLKYTFDGKTLYFIKKIPVDPKITI